MRRRGRGRGTQKREDEAENEKEKEKEKERGREKTREEKAKEKEKESENTRKGRRTLGLMLVKLPPTGPPAWQLYSAVLPMLFAASQMEIAIPPA